MAARFDETEPATTSSSATAGEMPALRGAKSRTPAWKKTRRPLQRQKKRQSQNRHFGG